MSLQATLAAVAVVACSIPLAARSFDADVCVYGGTSGGIIAALEVARAGKTAVIFESGEHLGGMSSGGLGWTDFANKAAVGGMAREFYREVGKRYGKPEEFNLEPHVAEDVFDRLAQTHGITVRFHERIARVTKNGLTIAAVYTDAGDSCQAPMFIDASYEGDLLPKAGIAYTVGRESNAQYGETLNGIQPPATGAKSGKFEVPVDPYRKKGDPGSGILPYLLRDEPLGTIGAADSRVQAYNYRLCLTNRPDNRVPIAPSPGYDAANFELLARWIEARAAAGEQLHLSDFLKYDPLPNDKWDFNNRWPISTDYLGGSDKYPEASWQGREEICRRHEAYLRDFLHFLATDSSVPQAVRNETASFGLAKDEFTKTRNWPHQIYVREARRMISDYVMTEANAHGKQVAPHPVALAAYNIDIHAVRRIVVNGQPVNEGSNGGSVPHPYPVAYQSIVPRKSQCSNLFVPFCLSASHVVFGSIRMEPVFMELSQAAAMAAILATEEHVAVQDVDYEKLKLKLKGAGVVFTWPLGGSNGAP
jgi:hypothetical protein